MNQNVYTKPDTENTKTICNETDSKSSTSSIRNDDTPTRKVSSRLINAFSNLYMANDGEQSTSYSNTKTPSRGMESRLMSMWHNVKYGWNRKLRSSFSKEQPVWLLGRCYHRKCTPPSSMENSSEFFSNLENKNDYDKDINHLNDVLEVHELGLDAIADSYTENTWEEGIEGFKIDFYSRLWMTYRREFPILNGSNYTSDCGWGCMLRSGQMLLGQALICHFLGRRWRWDPENQLNSTYEDNMHRKIIRWFGDSTSKNNPFSIHTLVSLGEEMGKKPGDWYGPASVSHLLRQAVQKAGEEIADLENISVYVAKNCTVYIQDILDDCLAAKRARDKKCPWKPQTDEHIMTDNILWKALIILVPLRLGADKLNPNYTNILRILLSTEYCIGIIGGRPKHSLYFVGFQEDKLIHLDPHYCQEMVDVNQENFFVHSFHCKSPRKLKSTKIDPSCCIGFYCKTRADFDNFVENIQMYLCPLSSTSISEKQNVESSNSDICFPIFVFSRGRSIDHQKDDVSDRLYKPLREQLDQLRTQQVDDIDNDDDVESEEFVIL